MPTARSAAEIHAVIAELIRRGWRQAGRTQSETVRIPTTRCPVFGGIGGELRIFGGRLRFARENERCTVGARTTCFYQMHPAGPGDFVNLRTNDLAAIRTHLDQEPPPPAAVPKAPTPQVTVTRTPLTRRAGESPAQFAERTAALARLAGMAIDTVWGTRCPRCHELSPVDEPVVHLVMATSCYNCGPFDPSTQ